jgi:hypothetical protein
MTWLRCVDHAATGRLYPLCPARVVYCQPMADGGWRAIDVLGRWHQVATDDDERIEALMGGGEPP